MYIILNLAIGGSWVGYPDQAAIDDMVNQEYDVDYVRVYQRNDYNEDVEPPVAETVELRDPDEDGNYVVNGNFAADENLTDGEGWQFMTSNDGEDSAEISEGAIIIHTLSEGSVDYSVQLVQANLPIQKGKKYELQFEASASEERQFQIAVQAPDKGWNPYMPAQVITVRPIPQAFDFTFDVTRDDDPNGRIDINMGHFGSTADITITNVSLKQIGEAEVPAEVKIPRSDGNRIYNGGFDEGIGRLGYWDIDEKDQPYVSVTNENVDGKRSRKLLVIASGEVSGSNPIIIRQDDILLSPGKDYVFSYEASASTDDVPFTVLIGGVELTDSLKIDTQTFTHDITMGETIEEPSVLLVFTAPGLYYLDQVYLSSVDKGLIKNGDFSDGQSSWSPYIDTNAKASVSYVDDQAIISIENTGTENWHIQLNQDGVNLEQGKHYRISLSAKSTSPRSIEFSLQHNGSSDNNWESYSAGVELAVLSEEYQSFSREFTMRRHRIRMPVST